MAVLTREKGTWEAAVSGKVSHLHLVVSAWNVELVLLDVINFQEELEIKKIKYVLPADI